MELVWSTFRHARDNRPRTEKGVWDRFVCSVLKPHDVTLKDKNSARAFSPAEYSPGATRAVANVQRVHFGVLDVDGVTNEQVESLCTILAPYAHVLYSTWGHAAARPLFKLRVVTPFDRPVEASEWRAFWPRFNYWFGSYGDTQCKDPSRIYFVPACPYKDQQELIWYSQEGRQLSVDAITRLDLPAEVLLKEAASQRTEAIHEEDLKLLARRLTQRSKPFMQSMGRALRHVLKGETFAEDGARDDTTFKLTGVIAAEFPGADPASVAAHFARSLALMGADAPTVQDVADKLSRHQDELERARLDKDRTKNQVTRSRIREALGGDREHPYTQVELEEAAALQQTSVEGLRTRWVIQSGVSYYVLVNGKYGPPYGEKDIVNGAIRDLAPAASAGVDVYTETRDGVRPKSAAELVEQYGAVAKKVVVSMTEQHGRYDSRPESQTFYEAAAPRRPVEPVDHPEVQQWLELLGGARADKLLDWVAVVTKLDTPCAALYLDGVPGTGKTLLADGLARLWASKRATPMEDAMGTFNDALMACPLVLADEVLPRDFKGNARTHDLRVFIPQDKRVLKRKYRAPATLVGCTRSIITANNDTLLSDHTQLTANDIAAIAERLIYLKCDAPARDYLDGLPRETLEKFAKGDWIAEHALWLAQTRKVVSDGRFLVKGTGAELHTALTTSAGLNGAVCNWLVMYLLEPAKVDSLGDGLVGTFEGRLYATPRGIAQRWTSYATNVHAPSSTQVKKALRALGAETDTTFRGATQARFYELRTDYLVYWAITNGYATEETLLQALKKEHKKAGR